MMRSHRLCNVTAIGTKEASHIIERQDNPGLLTFSEKPRHALEGYSNVNKYHLHLSYNDRIVASTDPKLNLPKIPIEILRFYARVNGIDTVMVKFRTEPRIITRKEGDLAWPELLQIPVLNGEEVQVELPKSFSTNYFRSIM